MLLGKKIESKKCYWEKKWRPKIVTRKEIAIQKKLLGNKIKSIKCNQRIRPQSNQCYQEKHTLVNVVS